MDINQISMITSIFLTIAASSATLIGLIFVAFTFTMQSRKQSRKDREERKKENTIMSVLLMNLVLPMYTSLFFVLLVAFNIISIDENRLMVANLSIVLSFAILILFVAFGNASLCVILNKTYKFVSGIGIIIACISVLISGLNYFVFGTKINVAIIIIYIVFLITMAVVQTWSYLNISSNYQEKENKSSEN